MHLIKAQNMERIKLLKMDLQEVGFGGFDWIDLA
jgi:hypothetical protein